MTFSPQKNGDTVVGAAIINSLQPPSYAGAPWACEAPEGDILVLHTLVIDPAAAGKGLGRAFVDFYEQGAKSRSCRALRMDTNARNLRARALYKKLGYTEVAIVPCTENGIPDVQLVLPENLSADRRALSRRIQNKAPITFFVMGALFWWARMGSNHRPPACEAGALTS